MKNILIVGSCRAGAIEDAYCRAFRRRGLSTEHFDLERPIASLTRSRVLNRLTSSLQSRLTSYNLLQYLQRVKKPYDIVIIFKGMTLIASWFERFRTATPRSLWININPDDPFNTASRGSTNQNVIDAIPAYDLYCTWGKHLIQALQSAGCKLVLHLPFAYDVDYHFPDFQHNLDITNKVTFIGTWDKNREQILTEIADFPLQIYGNGWNRISYRSPLQGKFISQNIYGAKLRQIVSSSLASLNILRPQNYRAHNMRTFEIPAMQGLMLTNFSEEQHLFFPNGQACLMYRNTQELRQQITAIFSENIKPLPLRSLAFELCRGQSYDDRASYLLEQINKYLHLR